EAGCALQGLQLATTAPYRRLALWLPYTLAVCAAARALGGRAGPAQMLAATSLYALPHLLDPLLAVPGLEGLARPVLFLWGAAIYLRAWAAASRLGGPRALLAVALPGLAAVTVVMVVMAIVALVWGLRN
ncbi:MAG TPA: hypothetical protein PLB78_16960, partial [Anaerolineae bacterium]|nr:hypothetical protein [Anaerolineae bacterium]